MKELDRDFDALIYLCKTSWSEAQVIAEIERLRTIVRLALATKG